MTDDLSRTREIYARACQDEVDAFKHLQRAEANYHEVVRVAERISRDLIVAEFADKAVAR